MSVTGQAVKALRAPFLQDSGHTARMTDLASRTCTTWEPSQVSPYLQLLSLENALMNWQMTAVMQPYNF